MSLPEKIPTGFSISKAHKAQKYLCKSIIQEDRLPEKIQLVAGVDVAYFDQKAVGAVSVSDYESLGIVESETILVPVKFPYIPTLLSFRELPAALAAIRKLKTKPDVFLVDAHGVAHPYGCGFASHLGLAINRPTIGVAKSRLAGTPQKIEGAEFLVQEGKAVAAILTTQKGAKPVYVSVGHLISLQTAIALVKHCSIKNRIPTPLAEAHSLASEKKREALSMSNRNSERTT